MSGEKALLDPKVESKGVEDILAALTKDEKDELADANMPLRHFRAEKVKKKKKKSAQNMWGLSNSFLILSMAFLLL